MRELQEETNIRDGAESRVAMHGNSTSGEARGKLQLSMMQPGAPAGGLGAAQLHSWGGAAPGFGAEHQMIQSSQPVWSRREEPNLSESSLAGGL